MKRSPMPPRRARISRGTKSLRSYSVARQKKRKARKPRLKKSVRDAVLKRDGYQCTHTVKVVTKIPDATGDRVWEYRCPETENLQVHELKYGTDNPDDSVTYCKAHHHAIEYFLRPWNRGRLGRG